MSVKGVLTTDQYPTESLANCTATYTSSCVLPSSPKARERCRPSTSCYNRIVNWYKRTQIQYAADFHIRIYTVIDFSIRNICGRSRLPRVDISLRSTCFVYITRLFSQRSFSFRILPVNARAFYLGVPTGSPVKTIEPFSSSVITPCGANLEWV